jgi:sigma-54 specific flagellar transcriptional regulator A
MHYAWPGNVRELGNLVERLSIMHPNKMVGVAELPVKYRPTGWVPSVEPEVPSMSALKSELGDPMPGEFVDSNGDRLSDALGDEQALQLLTANTHGNEVVEELTCLPIDGLDLRSHLYTIERALIRQALERSSGTVAQAARLLNLRRTTLVEKLRKFDMLADDAVHFGQNSEASEV